MGAKVVKTCFRNCKLFGKYLARHILEKIHMDAKVVTKASVAETSQSMFFRFFNFAANIQQGPIMEKNH